MQRMKWGKEVSAEQGLATTVHLRRGLRARGLPFGRRVGFGTTLGLRLGVGRFRGVCLPG